MQTMESAVDLEPPWGFRAVNRVGRALGRLGIGNGRLEAGSLVDEARRTAGLHDLGDDDGWMEGLERQLASYQDQGRLSFVGRQALRSEMQRILTQRLLIAQELAEHPEVRDVPVDEPVFILGFPRTGTTVLHNLFDQEPQVRTPRMWELLRPSPAPSGAEGPDEPRIRQLVKDVDRVHKTIPGLLRIHPLDATSPDECFFLFMLAFRPRTADAQVNCPDFMSFVMRDNMVAAYRYYRTLLQLLSRKQPGRRWCLKAPSHLFHLDALLTVFPDARVVQTHRDPRHVAGSCCSLYEVTRQLYTDHRDPHAIGQSWLDTWAVAMERALAVRDRHDPAQFTDVRFPEFVPDPAAGALQLMNTLGIEPSAGTESRMRAWLDAHRRGRNGRHTWELSRYGLDADQIRDRFATYIDRFDLEPS